MRRIIVIIELILILSFLNECGNAKKQEVVKNDNVETILISAVVDATTADIIQDLDYINDYRILHLNVFLLSTAAIKILSNIFSPRYLRLNL